MPLITPQAKPPERQPVSYKLESRIFRLLKRYAEFIDSTQEYVVNQALDATFARDREFRDWVTSHYPDDAAAGSTGPRSARSHGRQSTVPVPASDADED